MTHECDNLDAYLDGKLAADAQAQFESHATKCAVCREAIDQQHWIDSLLRSPLRTELEAPSPVLVSAIRDSLAVALPHERIRRRSKIAAVVLSSAAVLLIAAGWIALRERDDDGNDDRAVRDVASIADPAEPSPNPSLQEREIEESVARTDDRRDTEPPRATFVGTGDTIAVPLETSEPDVTVVRLYSAYQPAIPATVAMDQEPSIAEFDLPINN